MSKTNETMSTDRYRYVAGASPDYIDGARDDSKVPHVKIRPLSDPAPGFGRYAIGRATRQASR